MESWECWIEPSGYSKLSSNRNIIVPDSKDIDCAIRRIQPIPQVALKILRIIAEDDYNISKIAIEVRKGQVISARTLRLCNSVMFARKKRIDSVDHALVYLGQDQLVKLIISAALKDFFKQDNLGHSLSRAAFIITLLEQQLLQRNWQVLPERHFQVWLIPQAFCMISARLFWISMSLPGIRFSTVSCMKKKKIL